MHVKICGITSVEAAEAAVAAGADAVGFVFADSARKITPEDAARIAADLPGRVERFAVFLSPTERAVGRVLSVFPADVVQADYGALTQPDGARLLPVFREGDHRVLDDYLDDTIGRRFHYEGRVGGSGETVDWLVAARLAGRGRMTLAGGLDPDNVTEAIGLVQPFGVDVSSGVESAPGVKDALKIRDFVETVRDLEKER